MGDRTVILDQGSWSIKAGQAYSTLSVESDLPPLVTPTRVRVYDVRTKGQVDQIMEEAETATNGNGATKASAAEEGEIEAKANPGEYTESGPIKDGAICDWDAMEARLAALRKAVVDALQHTLKSVRHPPDQIVPVTHKRQLVPGNSYVLLVGW